MEIVMILIPITLMLVALGVVLFSWAVKSGQYDDLEGPGHRILYDDDAHMIPEESRQHKSETELRETDADTSQQPPHNRS